MRLVLLGSGAFGLPSFRRLAQLHEIAAVVTQPDRPAGRRRHLTPTPVGAWAQEANLPLLKTENVNDAAAIATLAQCKADAAVVIAFGQKLSPAVIAAMGKLAVNLHASLLPRYRGAAPINWAIIEGAKETGVSVIGLAQQMDAGPIYARAATLIDPQETAGELHDRLAEMGPPVLEETLDALADGTLEAIAQDDTQATRAPKLSKADGHVDFAQPAEHVRNRVHGLTPWPGVHVTWHGRAGGEQPLTLRRVEALSDREHDAAPGTVLDDLCVAAGDGAVRLLEVQAPGGRPMPMQAFARGHDVLPGDRLA